MAVLDPKKMFCSQAGAEPGFFSEGRPAVGQKKMGKIYYFLSG